RHGAEPGHDGRARRRDWDHPAPPIVPARPGGRGARALRRRGRPRAHRAKSDAARRHPSRLRVRVPGALARARIRARSSLNGGSLEAASLDVAILRSLYAVYWPSAWLTVALVLSFLGSGRMLLGLASGL